MTHTTPKRIAFIVPFATKGGAEVALGAIFSQLSNKQFEIFLVAPEEQYLVSIAKERGFNIYHDDIGQTPSTSVVVGNHKIFNPLATLITLWQLTRFSLRLRRWMKQQEIDVLYTGSMVSHFIGVFSCVLSARKLVWHMQDIMASNYVFGIGSHIFGFLGRVATTKIIVPSKVIADSIRYAHQVEVVPYGVDPHMFKSYPENVLRKEFAISDELPLIGLVGRLVYWKGHRLFLEALHQLSQRGYQFKGVIVGGSKNAKAPYLVELEKLADRLQLTDNIIFTGFRTDVPAVMHSLDVVVLASTKPEPFGLVVIEAMASGKPVVASAAGGPLEIILDNETGMFFEMGNAYALADTIAVLLDNPSRQTAYGEAGRKRAREVYSIERFGDTVTNVLHNL